MAWTARQRRVTRRKRYALTQAHAAPRVGVKAPGRHGYELSAARVAGLALALIAAAAIVAFSTSPAFFVYSDETRYVGLQLLAPETVWKAAGIPDGLSVFFVHTERIAQALKALPEVKDVRVTLRIPNRLTIAVTERAVQAAWVQAGTIWWVDESGHVLAQVQEDINAHILRIHSMVPTPLQPGSDVSVAAVRAVLRCAPADGYFCQRGRGALRGRPRTRARSPHVPICRGHRHLARHARWVACPSGRRQRLRTQDCAAERAGGAFRPAGHSPCVRGPACAQRARVQALEC